MNILLISTTNRNYPIDIEPEFKKLGHEIERLTSLEDFLCCPKRYQPFLAIFEIGSKEDYDKAFATYDWMERIQPTAPCRYLLLIASKHLEIREKLIRFSSAEIAYLPSPMKSLLFKAELQVQLLKQKQVQPQGFVLSPDPKDLKEERVMVFKGPNPESGRWEPDEFNPSGKIRWRWVNTEKKLDAEENKISWVAESKTPPVFKPEPQAWILDNEKGSDLKGISQEKEVFSAQKVRKILLDSMDIDPVSKVKPAAAAQKEKVEITKPILMKSESEEVKQAEKSGSSGSVPSFSGKPLESEVLNKKAEYNVSQREQSVPSTFDRTLSTPTTKEGKKISSAQSETNASSQVKAESEEEKATRIKREAKVHETVNTSSPQNTITEKKEKPRHSDPLEEIGKNRAEQIEIRSSTPSVVSSINQSVKEEVIRSSESVPVNIQEKEWNRKKSEEQNEDDIKKEKMRELGIPIDEPQGTRKKAGEPVNTSRSPFGKKTGEGNTNLPSSSPKKQEEIQSPSRPKVSDSNVSISEQPKTSGTSDFHGNDRAEKNIERVLQEEKPPKEPDPQNIAGEKAWDPIRFEEREESNKEREKKTNVAGERELVDVQRVEGTKQTEEDSGFLLTRHQITMTLEELNDHQSSWHPVDQYRIYLSAKHRYYGVQDVMEIFPLWIYEGELAPEFLESKKSWRFYDRGPRPYHSLEALPLAVFEFFSHFSAVKDLVAEKKKSFQSQNPTIAVPLMAEEPEMKKPPKRKGGLWGFLKKLFGG